MKVRGPNVIPPPKEGESQQKNVQQEIAEKL